MKTIKPGKRLKILLKMQGKMKREIGIDEDEEDEDNSGNRGRIRFWNPTGSW